MRKVEEGGSYKENTMDLQIDSVGDMPSDHKGFLEIGVGSKPAGLIF